MGERLRQAKAQSGDHYGLSVAAAVIEEALAIVEPDGALVSNVWESYAEHLQHLLGGEPTEMETLVKVRQGLECLKADTSEAEFAVCAVKVALSAMILGATNQFSIVLAGRSRVHDDIDPLARKAAALLEAAQDVAPGDFSVSYDDEIVETLNEQLKKNMMTSWITNAIRPGDPRNN